MSKGFLHFVLHAHLPFVKHPEFDRYLEENWFFESLTDTYIPLVAMLEKLQADGIPSNITLSISPTLGAMLKDELLSDRYRNHVQLMIELGEKELASLPEDSPHRNEASRICNRYRKTLEQYDLWDKNLLGVLGILNESGSVTLITTSATHAYLPMYQGYPQAVAGQVAGGLQSFEYYLKQRSKGFWLPECGFYHGLDDILAREQIAYTYVSSHGHLFSESSLPYGVYAPMVSPSTGIAFFGRDFSACQDIWDPQKGYPADGAYRDFHSDIGFYRDIDYLRGFIHEPGVRSFTGYKYFAVTSIHEDAKVPYDHRLASRRVKEHVSNFLHNREFRVDKLSKSLDIPPCFTITLDAELFGHWWHEGVEWLEQLIRVTHEHPTLSMVTAEQYLGMKLPVQQGIPTFSSWGDRGYAETWLDGSNDEIYRYLHKGVESVIEMVNRFPHAKGLQKRTIHQAIKELFLAMSSDWAFLIKSGAFSEYASSRIIQHIKNCDRILSALSQWNADAGWILQLEKDHNILPGLDSSVFLDPENDLFTSI